MSARDDILREAASGETVALSIRVGSRTPAAAIKAAARAGLVEILSQSGYAATITIQATEAGQTAGRKLRAARLAALRA